MNVHRKRSVNPAMEVMYCQFAESFACILGLCFRWSECNVGTACFYIEWKNKLLFERKNYSY